MRHDHFKAVLAGAAGLAVALCLAPDATDLTIDGAAGVLRVGDLGSAVTINALALEGSVGDVRSAQIRVSGSGDLQIGDIAEAYAVSIAGSGTVVSGAVDPRIAVNGSGDVVLGGLEGSLGSTGQGDVVVRSPRD